MSSVESPNFDEYESLLVMLQNDLGIVVTDDQRGALLANIETLMVNNNLDSIAALTQSVSENNEFKLIFLETLSLHHSSWKLTSEIEKILHDYIFSQLPERAKICIVGCGQGQLAYRVAMEIAEYENRNSELKNFQLFATDSVENDLKVAEGAVYTKQQMKSLSVEYMKQYVTANDSGATFKIKEKISQTIRFLQYNLAIDLSTNTKLPKEVDLIICPEALVYFTNNDRAEIIAKLSEMLKPGGIFLIGNHHSVLPQEAITDNYSLERVEHPSGNFYRCVV